MHQDNWAIRARKLGYRSRAAFKLEEILSKINYKKAPKLVLDLGASPGGWSQLIKNKYKTSKIFAVDILEMDPIDEVEFFLSSIEDISSIDKIEEYKGSYDLVISDIAPNLTGIGSVDAENIFYLNKICLDVAKQYLRKNNGSFLIKTFQNNMLKNFRKDVELFFKIVQTYKPAASKKKSGEIYLYGANKE